MIKGASPKRWGPLMAAPLGNKSRQLLKNSEGVLSGEVVMSVSKMGYRKKCPQNALFLPFKMTQLYYILSCIVLYIIYYYKTGN